MKKYIREQNADGHTQWTINPEWLLDQPLVMPEFDGYIDPVRMTCTPRKKMPTEDGWDARENK